MLLLFLQPISALSGLLQNSFNKPNCSSIVLLKFLVLKLVVPKHLKKQLLYELADMMLFKEYHVIVIFNIVP